MIINRISFDIDSNDSEKVEEIKNYLKHCISVYKDSFDITVFPDYDLVILKEVFKNGE